VPWAGLEAAKDELAENWDNVAPVKGNGTDVEDTQDRGVATKPDQIDGDAEEDGDPDGVDGSTSAFVNLGPHPAEGNEAVAREGEHGTPECLGSGEANKLKDDKGTERKHNTACLAKGVEVDLSHGLCEG